MLDMLYNTVMHIESSLDWAAVESHLFAQARQTKRVVHDMQARRLVRNLQPMVTELSNLEVLLRRNKQKYLEREVADKIAQINAEIKNIEQWLLMLMLSN